MKANRSLQVTVLVALLFATCAAGVWAQEQKPPQYTRQEFDAFEAARNEQNPQQRIAKLDGFVAQYPNSELVPYTYQIYYTTHFQLRNYPKTIEYIDKYLSLGDKNELAAQFQALYIRAQVFEFAIKPGDPQVPEQAAKAIEAANRGVQVLEKLPKPENLTEEQFAAAKKASYLQFYGTAGFAALQIKNYPAATENFQKVLAIDANLAPTWYRLAVAHLQSDPPKSEDGFWALARAIALKIPNDNQVRNYLRAQLTRYQQTACEKEIDGQMNELIALATASPQRPAGHHIPSAQEISAARAAASGPEGGLDVATFVQTMRGGGQPARVMWLSFCTAEFPEFPGKVIEVAEGTDSVMLKLFVGISDEDLKAGSEANMEVKVVGQPAARLLKKDDQLLFSATLVGYTPDPFMLRWENGKVKDEFLPEDKPQPTKAPPKKQTKRPPKRPPAR